MLNGTLVEELMTAFNNFTANGIKACDVMAIEVQEDCMICRQLSPNRELFESFVSKLADVWRPVVRRFGLFIGQRRAGIRFLDPKRLGIYFGVEKAQVDLIASDMNK